jgi:hypothetical protein
MVEYARIITKSSEGPPTIPPSASHDNGDWSANDIYEHELYMDSLTGYVYSRSGDTIVLLSTGQGFSKWIEIDVLNGNADPLPKMAVCYFRTSSSSADTPEVLLADNSTEATSSKTMGLLKDTIAPGDTGKLILVGEYNEFDTSAYNVGDRLWLGNFGGILTAPPAAPRHAVFIGVVSRSHPTQGRICVSIQNGYELEEIHNVTDTNYATPQDEDSLLILDEATALWKRLTMANAFNAFKKSLGFYLHRNFTQGANVTGTTSEVQVFQLLIPANTFSTTDKLAFFAVFSRVTAATLVSLRAKISTSATMPSGATGMIARLNPAALNVYAKMSREMIINGGNIRGVNNNTPLTFDTTTSTSLMSSQAIDVTVDNYFYLSVQLTAATDDVRLEAVEIKTI